MRPFAESLERAGGPHGLAVARLRYAVRGWNGTKQSPLADVVGAIDALQAAHPGAPIALVGHSMGGRAALHAAGHPGVSTVVGLAPWIERGDPVGQVSGRYVLLAHGLRDHTTSPQGSAAFARAAQGVAESATYVAVHGDGHALIRRPRLWHDLATGYVLATLCDVPADTTVRRDAANVVGKALAGSTELDV
jgi:pimeloyl-ACP methyl ester carboxylesterase